MRGYFQLQAMATVISLLALPACGSAVTRGSSAGVPEPAKHEQTATAAAQPSPAVAAAAPTTPQPAAPQVKPAAGESQPNAAPAPASADKSVTADARASEVIRQAREALGGESKLSDVHGFILDGSFRRQSGGQEQSGRIELDALLPDKFKSVEELRLIADITLTMARAVNGEQFWTDTRTGASNAQVMTVRRNNNLQQSDADQLKEMRGEFARFMLALFLTTPESVSAELTYAGEAAAGDVRADVLDAKGRDGFAARLFVDKKTHRPLMLTYRGVPFRTNMRRSSGQDMSDVDKAVKEAKEKPAAARQESEIQIHFSDYRAVGGIMLPHTITKTIDDKPYEEWDVSKFKVNPADLGPQKFVKK